LEIKEIELKQNLLLKMIFILLFIFNISFAQNGLSVHGYLSQAYAISDGHQISGISDKGTTDYRTLAFQFRYEMNEQNNIIVQFSHKRLGLSPLMSHVEAVELDWAFYQYHFSEETSIKVGKIQLPFGIYNEIRDVGTLIPFYRLPSSTYGEGNYMSETVDGLSYYMVFNFPGSWSVSTDMFAGHWKWVEQANLQNPIGDEPLTLIEYADINRGGGLQLWLNLPWDEMRIGIDLIRGFVSGGLSFTNDRWIGERNFFILNSSLDINVERGFLRSEFLQVFFDDIPAKIQTMYIQVGL